ncbi:MAG: hypothetical protein PF795_00950 [Kiritimatiellae bacterium]|jgi:hypothetical protein|nr:hypothetical protein [Kiritimatiellia bacterium]
MRLIPGIAILTIASLSHAATISLDGDFSPLDNSWSPGGNWVDNTAPLNGDYGDIAKFTRVFNGGQFADVDGVRSVQGVIFMNVSG